jgi:hypothetical protein
VSVRAILFDGFRMVGCLFPFRTFYLHSDSFATKSSARKHDCYISSILDINKSQNIRCVWIQ